MKRLIVMAALVGVASCGGGGSPSAPSPPGTDTTPTAGISLTGNLAFGNVLVGTTSTSTLTISNPGTAALTVTGLTGPGGFTARWTSGAIAAGASQAVIMEFAPTTAGDYGGMLTVNANHGSGTNTMSVTGAAYSNMNGTWTGTQVATGVGVSAVCDMSWIATGQTGSQFSGTWQTSGFRCSEAGTFTGSVTTANAITGLSFEVVSGVPANNCVRVTGDGLFSGVLSGSDATVKATDTLRCPGLGDVNRSTTLSMKKQ
jgi:hypothetical protein